MRYFDFHTHHIPTETDVVAVVSGRDTWGIHPWQTDDAALLSRLQGEGGGLVLPLQGEQEAMLAIGECGLDATRGATLAVQEDIFLQHIALSERLGKPVVVHCVKALDHLLRLHRQQQPSVPWLFHGFRGKPQQLRSLLDAGFYVSFGFRHNEESLRLCPEERLLLETDDERLSIKNLYRNVAALRGVDEAFLCDEMAKNYQSIFSKNTSPG